MIPLSLSRTTSYKTNDGSSTRDRVSSIRIMGGCDSSVVPRTSILSKPPSSGISSGSLSSTSTTASSSSSSGASGANGRLDIGALVKETEIAQEHSDDTFLDDSALTTQAILLFMLHVTRWLYKQTIRDSPSTVSLPKRKELITTAIQAVCELIRTRTPGGGRSGGRGAVEEISVKTWNALFDAHGQYDPGIWVSVLKVFVYKFEIIPRDTAEKLLEVCSEGKALGGGVTTSNTREQAVRKSSLGAMFSSSSHPSAAGSTTTTLPQAFLAQRNAFVPLLEDLSSTRHQVLAALCLLLQRDRKQRKQVVSVFGPWLLLSSSPQQQYLQELVADTPPREEALSKVRAAAEVMEVLIAIPESLFGISGGFPMVDSVVTLAETHEPTSPTAANGSSSDHRASFRLSKPSLLKRGTSLRLMIKKFGIPAPSMTTTSPASGPSANPASTTFNNNDQTAEHHHHRPMTDDEAEKVLDHLEQMVESKHLHQSLKDRPARSRQSLERVYGRAPPPPPPISTTSSAMRTSPVLSPSAPPAASTSTASNTNPVMSDLQEMFMKRNNSVTSKPAFPTQQQPPPAHQQGIRKASTTTASMPARQPPPLPVVRPSPIRSASNTADVCSGCNTKMISPDPHSSSSSLCSYCAATSSSSSGSATTITMRSPPPRPKQTGVVQSTPPVAGASRDPSHHPASPMMQNGVKLIPIGSPYVTGVKNTTPSKPAIPSTRPKQQSGILATMRNTTPSPQNAIAAAAQASARRRSVSKE